MVPVTVSGTLAEGACALKPTVLSYVVRDEYGLVHAAGSIVPGSDGAFSASVLLQASRQGDDRNGRQYTITLTVQGVAGAATSAVSVITVPHNR
jgi:hypothetical protein